MRTLAWILLGAGALYALACLALFLAQRSLIFFPQPRRSGAPASVMTLEVKDAQLEVSMRAREGRQAVIYFGGNAEDVSGSLPDLADAFPAQALYLLHYRGYGGSSGKPGQDALFSDALALFDRVHAWHPEVTVVGRSLGSGVAVYLASARPAARLVLVTPYDSIAALAAQQFPMFPVRALLRDPFDSWRYAPLVTAPTTLVAAERDEVIPRASTDLLLTRFRSGIARRIVIPAAGPNTLSDHPSYSQALAGEH